jgi:hypothetical protein
VKEHHAGNETKVKVLRLTRDLAGAGVTLLVARLESGLRHRFDEGGVTAVIGPGHFHPTVRAAVAACRAEDRRPESSR